MFVFLGLIRFQTTKTKHEDSTNDWREEFAFDFI